MISHSLQSLTLDALVECIIQGKITFQEVHPHLVNLMNHRHIIELMSNGKINLMQIPTKLLDTIDEYYERHYT